jgi:putative transcriptional regulator
MAKAIKTSKAKKSTSSNVRYVKRDEATGKLLVRKSTGGAVKAKALADKPTEADQRLMAAAKEMLAHHRGELKLETRKTHVPEKIDVAAIRKGLGFSQSEFADHFGFAISAIKEWEQGRRAPERATRILLAVIAMNPKAVEQALHRFV